MSSDQKVVLVAGAFGGLASWAYSILVGTTFGIGMWPALPLCVILGIAAAFVAVYMITPTDVTQTGRLLGYALLCGIMWKPVLDGASAIIKQRMVVSDTRAQVHQDASMLANAPASQIDAKRTDATAAVTKLLHASDQLGSPDLKQQAAKPAADAVNAIAATSTQNPAAAHQALQQIAIVAKQTDNAEVLRITQEKLKLIPLKQR